jgi:glycosyltransferase involved in cell wall biosynthesis
LRAPPILYDLSSPMTAPCRVLVLNERCPFHPKAGGAEVHVAEVFRRLAERGFAVTLATSSFSGAALRQRFAGIDILRLGPLPLYYPRVAWRCARETRRGRFDVVVECLNKVPFYAPLYSAVPVLALCHHLFGEVAFLQVRWPVAAAVWAAERFIPPLYATTSFVTISESSRRDLIARGIPADRVRVIHCGIDRPAVEGDVTAPRPPRVAFVGRLEPYKHVDVMLRAMARLTGRFPTAEIVVIGRGSERARLEALAGHLGLAGRTRFTGFVAGDERDRLLAASRVAVCPSAKEGWGLTVIESNRVGTPVVASDAPGLRDSVRHGETGFLACPNDVGDFAERIAALLADDGLAVRMSQAALAWSRSFDWDTAADEMAEAIIGTARRPG